jgi:hypothetical protein
MASLPETKYAKSGGLSIAYQPMGSGPLDLVAGSDLSFHEKGEHHLQGVPGKWQLFAAAV